MITLPTFKKRQSTSETERPPLATTYNPKYDGAALAALVTRAEKAVEQLQSLESIAERAAELGAMEERIAGLERSLEVSERITAQLHTIEEQAARLTAAHEQSSAKITAADAELARLHESSTDLLAKINDASGMREQLEQFLAIQPQFSALRRESEATNSQLRELGESLGRLRAVHDDVLHAQKHAASRLEGVEQRSQAAVAKVDAVERRAATAQEALDGLLRIAGGIPDAQHQLGVLKAIAEQVAQKTAVLEQQREAVDRAAAQAAEVLSLRPQVESALRRQEEQVQAVTSLEAKLAGVQTLHTTVLARAEEITAQQHTLEEAEQAAQRSLSGMRDEMKSSAERFELENRSLDAVSERIVELRTAQKDCETRLSSLDATARTLAETDARSHALAEQVGDLAEDIERITSQADRLRAVRDDVGGLESSLSDMTQRMERVEALKPDVESILRDLAKLNGTHESIRDGLEQVRLSYEEMTRLRERQAQTDQWLADADVKLRATRELLAELDHMRPGTEALRDKVAQITASMDALEGRAAMLDTMQRRLGEIDSALAQAQDRGTGLNARMEAAETRFSDLLRQAAEARRVAQTIGTVTASVEAADRRMTSVGAVADALGERSAAFSGLEDRLRVFNQEFEQRQTALEAAAANLAQASTVRREAADAMQQLDELSRTIGGQLGDAQQRTGTLSQMLDELEGRLDSLGEVEKRMANFEALLATWDAAQRDAAQGMEQIGSKQATIDAVSAQVKHLFEVAERTAEHVRSISTERREIEDARAVLERTRGELSLATDGMRVFSDRKWQVEDIERRLAKADALARDIRSSTEALAAQRAVVDRALDGSAALALQMKQADAMMEALRQECAAAARLRSAMDDARGD
ncbi:MAG TPA: hypothetical protein VN607_06010 [Gemmatimonadaceae bacterium]|nr:hypothetical protein [Gemmatimonadaceae bacterium]